MRRPFLVLALAVSQLVRSLPPTTDQNFALFGEYVESLRAQAGIPGLSAAIVVGNDIAWERAFGQQDIDQLIAARTDTPFHLDGLTQLVTASLVLRCVEEGRLSLDDRIGQFDGTSPDANATIRQVLTHTSGAPDALVFAYRLERLAPLRTAIRTCEGGSFRKTLANLLERLAMNDSVPGPDVIQLVPPAEGIPSAAQVERYAGVLNRLATFYSVDARGRASRSLYTANTLTPASGLISTVRDYARFDVALRSGALVRSGTLASAWRAPVGRDGKPLPHGLGWFVQSYNGTTIVWQFGVSDNASSSLVVTVPARGFSLILLANSDGLVKSFGLSAGDLTTSPFARSFLGLFVR